jgi:hypothetical protein
MRSPGKFGSAPGGWLLAAAIAAAALFGSRDALARPTVAFTRVEVRAGDDAPRLGHDLRAFLTQATRHANFGPGGKKTKIDVTARLLEFSEEERDGVLRIRCAMSGRIVGGRGARSKISFGGSPRDRAKLEKQVLKMVADGLVARLAQIARTDAASR